MIFVFTGWLVFIGIFNYFVPTRNKDNKNNNNNNKFANLQNWPGLLMKKELNISSNYIERIYFYPF